MVIAQDGVALAERLQAVAGDGARAADTQAGAGERLTIDHVVRQAQFLADDANLVLEEQLDGLDELELKVFGETAHVVVGLDRTGFDDVRVDGALRQEADAVQLAGLFLEHADEFRADDLTLLLGIRHAGQLVQEAVDGIDINQVGLKFVAEDAHHLLGLALAQESMVDVDGNQLLTDGLDEEGGNHGGVHTARQGEQHLLVADLGAQFLNLFFDEFPRQFGSGDPLHVRGTNVSCSHIVFCLIVYSHSIVAGGFELTSYTTRLTPRTLLMISLETSARKSYGSGNQSAVIASVETTARSATGCS